MRKGLLLTLFLSLVVGLCASAQTTHYKPGEKKSSFAVGDKFFFYSTALVLNAEKTAVSQNRTGFLANGGESLSLVKETPYAGASNIHYDSANESSATSVWTVASVELLEDGACIKLSVKANNGNYLSFNGSTTSRNVQYIYLRNWANASSTSKVGDDVVSETGIDNAYVAHSTLTESDNLFIIGNAQSANKHWNGNVSSFATWNTGYPYACYAVMDASVDYAPILEAAQPELTNFITTVQTLATNNYSATSTALTLSTSNLTTNADQNTGGNKDGDGIAALIDNNKGTYWHSSWEQSGAQNPQDWHYLQVDAGALIDGFNFSYSTRNNGEQNPTSFEIQASEDGTNFDYVITLDVANDWMPSRDLTYQKASVTYNSYDIAFRKRYQYVRFVCKSNTSGTTLSGYPIFALSEFSFNKLSFGESTTTPNQKIRYARLNKAIGVAQASNALKPTGLVAEVTAAKNELNVHYLAAQRTAVPDDVTLTLTEDQANPVLYFIHLTGRTDEGGSWHYQYKLLNDGMIKLENTTTPATNIYNYWYFMENPRTGYVRLYAYTEPNAPMGYRSVTDGNSKITNVSTSANPIVGYDYEVVASGNATRPVALKPAGYSTYVSNHGGYTNYMGFYNSKTDGGTGFALVAATTPTAGDKLIELAQTYKTAPIQTRLADSMFGTSLNHLDINWMNTFDNIKVNVLNGLTTTANTISAEGVQSVLDEVNANLDYLAYPHMVQPQPCKFYRFKSVKHNQRLRSDVGAVYTSSSAESTTNRLLCGSADDNGRNSIFYLDENNNLVAYVEGQYMTTSNTALSNAGSAGTAFTFMPGIDHASYRICDSNGRSVYCQKATKTTTETSTDENSEETQTSTSTDYYFWDFGNISYGNYNDNGYDWIIEEITWLPVGVNTTAGYGTLKSPVALAQSDGRITAYTGTVDGSTLRLKPIEGNIPAGTPVVFKYNSGEENGNVFLQVVSDNTAAPDQDLTGSYTTFPKTGSTEESKVIYTLQQLNGNTGFFQYNGTNIVGFRAYLSLDTAVNTESNALKLEFDNTVTGIDEIMFDDDVKQSNIYDLSGRRVNRMTKGMYIINGQKVLIK